MSLQENTFFDLGLGSNELSTSCDLHLQSLKLIRPDTTLYNSDLAIKVLRNIARYPLNMQSLELQFPTV